jgi:NAD(P)-dependent dehydrogenase (short-subunit alcohol dehydrogenase family)
VNRVLVVGASRGIGLEFVRQYRQAGSAVTATSRSDAGLAQLQALGALALPLDVISPAGGTALSGPLHGQRFDLVVLNAGVYGPRTQGLEAPSQADFDAVMHTNVWGAMRLLPQLLGALAPQARLAVVSSRMGSLGERTSSAGWLYRASKAALNSVLKDASLVLQGQAICVALHPGWLRTDMGGPEADLDVATGVSNMRRTLAGLTASDNGGFFNHDGQPLPW